MAVIYVLAIPLGIVFGIAAGLLMPHRAKRPQRH